jgi:hypothetical protein
LPGAAAFSEDMAAAPHDARARKEAFEAARARAAGKSREQVTDLYKAELRTRGMEIPPKPILDAKVSPMAGDYLSAGRLFDRSRAGLGH